MSYFEERSMDLVKLQNIFNEMPSEMIDKFSDVPEILRLNSVSICSGMNLSKFGLCNYKYTQLDHAIGVALILEKFKQDNTQIIAGLLSNINSPAFCRASGLMKQDIFEYSNYDQIVGSDMLFEFFLKNNIDINLISNLSTFPLIKGMEKRLNACLIEKLLHLAFFEKLCNETEIKELFDDIVIVPNEDNKPEFAFETPELGVKFSKISMEIGKKFRSYEAKITLQIIADLLDLMIRRMEIRWEDLYKYGERTLLEIGINSSDKQISDGWKSLLRLDKVYSRFTPNEEEYCKKINLESKYVDSLVRIKGGYERTSKYNSELKREMEIYINSDTDLYAYCFGLDFLR